MPQRSAPKPGHESGRLHLPVPGEQFGHFATKPWYVEPNDRRGVDLALQKTSARPAGRARPPFARRRGRL